jgi:hypothetical protein
MEPLVHPAVTDDFTVGSEIACQPCGRSPIRLPVTSVQPGSAITFEALAGPFAVPGATTSVRLVTADDGRTVVDLWHDTPPIPDEALAACNTYWGVLLGQLRELEVDLFARWQGPPAEHSDRSSAAADHRGNGSESRHSARLTAATNSSSPT